MNSYYFSHDYSARSDFKIKKLLQKHGILGYGVFWAIVEELYLNANALPTDYDSIAYELRIDVSIVKSVINDFELFEIAGDYFGSMSVQRRIDEREQKSENARKSARIRWGNKEKNANAMPTHTEGNAINKIKEIKSNKENKDICVSNENELFTPDAQLPDLKKEDTDTQPARRRQKTEIPDKKEFMAYGKEILKERYNDYEFVLDAKFDSWVASGWEDGNGNPIKAWRNKLRNVIPFLKPFSNKPQTTYSGLQSEIRNGI